MYEYSISIHVVTDRDQIQTLTCYIDHIKRLNHNQVAPDGREWNNIFVTAAARAH